MAVAILSQFGKTAVSVFENERWSHSHPARGGWLSSEYHSIAIELRLWPKIFNKIIII